MKQILLKFRKFILLLPILFAFQLGFTQELFVGANSEFHLKKNTDFTTTNTIVTVDVSGEFSVEAGSNWGSQQEYVNGKVSSYGNGTTKLPVGNNGVYAPVNATHTGKIVAAYFNTAPMAGTNGLDVDAVADVEYWEISGNAVITLPWNNNSDITSLVNNNGGVIGSVAIVGLNGGIWNLISATQTNTITGDLLNGDVTSDVNNEADLNNFIQLTFGIDHQVALSINDLFLSTGISLLSNPVKADESSIRFYASNELIDLKVTLYDLTGRRIKFYNNIKIFNGIGNLEKPNLRSGLYFLKFDHQGKQGVKKLLIE
jgi:hypothetical protein